MRVPVCVVPYSLPTVHNDAQSVQAVWQSADMMEAACSPGDTSLAVQIQRCGSYLARPTVTVGVSATIIKLGLLFMSKLFLLDCAVACLLSRLPGRAVPCAAADCASHLLLFNQWLVISCFVCFALCCAGLCVARMNSFLLPCSSQNERDLCALCT
jgi:hypothetical protein